MDKEYFRHEFQRNKSGLLVNFKRIAIGADPLPLLAQIKMNENLWGDITGRQDTPGSPHKYTRTIFLKWAKELTVDAAFNDLSSEFYPAIDILSAAKTLINGAIDWIAPKEIGRIIIVALDPGERISPHFDDGAYADHFERFHLCLQSLPGNLFCSQFTVDLGEHVHMLPGELWWFNHKAVHWLWNESKEPRIHLIIDAVVPNFRVERGWL